MTPFRIISIEDKPERDPYRNDGSASVTTLNVDPQDRTVWVTQDYRTNSTPMSYWLHHRYALPVGGHPKESVLRQWIEHESTQAALVAIAEGHSIEWNRNNQQGILTDEAHDELDALQEELDRYFDGLDNWEYWDTDDWLGDYPREDIKASTTDEELARMAADLESDAESQGVVLSNDLLGILRYYRDNTAEENEE